MAGQPDRGGYQGGGASIAIDARLGEPHAALARFHLQRMQWAHAEREAREAVWRSPQDITGRQWYGTILGRLGKCDEALKQVALGADLDPRTPTVNEAVGRTHAMCGRPELAIEPLKGVLELHRDFITSYVGLGIAYLQLQRYRESVDILRRGHKVAPEACGVTALLADALILAGHRAQGTELARTVLRQGRSRARSIRGAR